jgi:hypothetical protein
MKAFKLNMHFRLPDDFTGDLNDAIECMLKYRKDLNKGHSGIFEIDPEISQYENFMGMITTTDRVLLADTWMGIYNTEENKWEWEEGLKISKL